METNELTIGETYIIDAGFRNSGEVVLIKIYGRLFCRVKNPDNDYEWDTMLNRLSNKPENSIVKP